MAEPPAGVRQADTRACGEAPPGKELHVVGPGVLLEFVGRQIRDLASAARAAGRRGSWFVEAGRGLLFDVETRSRASPLRWLAPRLYELLVVVTAPGGGLEVAGQASGGDAGFLGPGWLGSRVGEDTGDFSFAVQETDWAVVGAGGGVRVHEPVSADLVGEGSAGVGVQAEPSALDASGLPAGWCFLSDLPASACACWMVKGGGAPAVGADRHAGDCGRQVRQVHGDGCGKLRGHNDGGEGRPRGCLHNRARPERPWYVPTPQKAVSGTG